jgi:hypothetical protein
MSRIAFRVFDAGISTFSFFAMIALRIIAKASAIKSVLDMCVLLENYQLAFLTPGINPAQAISLKQMRQS